MNYPQNDIHQNPNKTWGFVGRVDVRLAFGKSLVARYSDEQAREIAVQHGPSIGGKRIIETRVFPSKEAAIQAARALALPWSDSINGLINQQ